MGADQVTTVEIDPDLSAQAARNLKAAGFSPRLVIGDGLAGYAETAPYDRVHCTCAIAAVPYAWVEQTRPGGRIVAPISSASAGATSSSWTCWATAPQPASSPAAPDT
ncbi:hypothetical protein GCM10022214_00710 [Actinomadura miaoliensis]|uniref:Protein-L-isoaspartate O-methyltransferase n=1 Tax=Actinomadura miaoliensis TaxID=430685 RepID=A0ABP7UXW9_9ACTN